MIVNILNKIIMQKCFLISALMLFSISCNSQKEFVKYDTNCKFDNVITEQEKKFNVGKYDSILSLQGNLTLINNDFLLSEIWKLSDGEYSNKLTNKQTNIGKWLMYFNNGKLKIADFKYEKGFEPIGIETHYDQNGNIIKTIDHRQADKYPICFKEAIAIVKKRVAKRDTVFSLRREKEARARKDTLYYWEVFIDEYTKKPGRKSWLYRVDASNGKIISKGTVTSNPG